MTAKTFTLTAEVEYDPSATSVVGMAASMHHLLQDGFDVELLDAHGELCVHSCVVSEGPPEEGPPKLFDEHDAWTDYGRELAHRIGQVLRPIAEECLKDGVDLRHAAFITQQETDSTFLKVCMDKRLAPGKKKS